MAVLAFDNFVVREDNGAVWIVRKKDGAAFASQMALAWMCEAPQPTISDIVNGNEKAPKALRDIDFSDIVRIKNVKADGQAGLPIIGIPHNICRQVLKYYAFTAKGHEKRLRAKELYDRMADAGSKAFIYQMAGYRIHAEAPVDILTASPTRWIKRFPDEYFLLAYRILGVEPPSRLNSPDWAMKAFTERLYKEAFGDIILERVKDYRGKDTHEKLHQYFAEAGIDKLVRTLDTCLGIMRVAPEGNPARFWRLLHKALSPYRQLELPGLEDVFDEAN